jgi:8-oxo-dGTP diphosphatase
MTDTGPSITKAAALLLDAKGRVLVVKSKKKDVWMSLGGKPEPGETLEDCVRREVKEEIGLEVTSAELFTESPIEPAAGNEQITVKLYFFMIQAKGDIRLNPEDNITEYKWISKQDFEEIKAGNGSKIGSGLEYYAIPKLIEAGLVK